VIAAESHEKVVESTDVPAKLEIDFSTG